jgi:hydrophobic/amphiphilic exporter-1 (mainly G- bacteria), HAE1 family
MSTKLLDRPILALVMSILLVLAGALALQRLPMSQFPAIAPPEVNVTVEYTGANAETVTKAAIVPLERSINGVPGMKYMSSDAGNDGVGVVQVLFEVGTDPDVAAVNVQNRVAAVMGELPAEVIRNGVRIAKEENAMLMYVNLFSADPELDEKFLYNFADIHVLAELKRVKGVGYADILGAREYAMRIWLRPDRMLAYGVDAQEILDALADYSLEAAPGKVGENSDRGGHVLQYVVRYPGKLRDEEQYRAIPVRTEADGQMLRLGELADVEFGTTYFDVEAKFDGRPTAALMLKQLPGSNASEVIAAVKARLADLKVSTFLRGMDYAVTYDVSRFLDASVRDVLLTLVEAFLLVAVITFVFLQNWRMTLIPMLAVPVSLVGTFVFVLAFGFSLNLITLLALVLAIGIVVDGAIVVVEAVSEKMERSAMTARQATGQAMKEIGGAVAAITLVMAAVFVPVGTLSGPVGVFFREYALTMAAAIVLSGFVALTSTPALCVLLLRAQHHGGNLTGKTPWWRWPLRWFDRCYGLVAAAFARAVAVTCPRPAATFTVLFVCLAGTAWLATRLPTGFLPIEDQGTFYVSVTTPPGATLERTKAVVDEVQRRCADLPGVKSISTLSGTNVLSDGTGATYGTCLFDLVPWDRREQSVDAVMVAVQERVSDLRDATIEVFPPPSVPGYGNASGFELRLLDRTGTGDLQRMETVLQEFLAALRERPEIATAFTIFDVSYPQYMIDLDVAAAAQKGVTPAAALDMLQVMLGGEYATNFIRFGQLYKVMVQALPEYRQKPEDILRLRVRNDRGEMVELASILRLEKVYGVDQITRYNMFPSAEVNGSPATGFSSGDAIAAIQQTARDRLPPGFAIDWAGITRDEVATGGEVWAVFGICVLFVYLLLAAQYESFLLPLSVLLSVPTGLLGSFLFLWWFGLENNIYAQAAMLMLVGLLGKNSILMVEFAAMRHRAGRTALQAAIEGASARLRPIVMTSLAMIVGLLPLLLADGVGANGNRTIGAAAIGGMLTGTLLGVLVTPGLYFTFAKFAERRQIGREPLPLTEEA